MLFELTNNTECTLMKFVGRTQKSGKEDVPAVSFRLSLTSVSNVLLDLFSKTMRHTVYEPVPGQDQLPGVEVTTPILRSKDLKHWAPEDVRYEGWRVIVARGIDDTSALQMGKCKLDDFKFDFFEGGHMNVDFRISTADLDEEGAGMLWGRQERKVFVHVVAPEVPAPAIDGSKDGGGPGFDADEQRDATDLFTEQHGDDGDRETDGADDEADDDIGEMETDHDETADHDDGAWPFRRTPKAKRRHQSVTVEGRLAATGQEERGSNVMMHLTDAEHAGLLSARDERDRLKAMVNTPELDAFLRATHIEAVHQVDRWGQAQDRAKRPADWFWLVGYLAGKALHAAIAGDRDKARHHCISSAAALYNWHCAIKGVDVHACPGRSDIATIVEASFPGEAPAEDDPRRTAVLQSYGCVTHGVEMTIIERSRVRDAVARALQLDPHRDQQRAVEAVAAALALPVETVAEVVVAEEAPAC